MLDVGQRFEKKLNGQLEPKTGLPIGYGKNSKGQKTTKLKEKTQGSGNVCKIGIEIQISSKRMSSLMLVLPDTTKNEHFYVKLKLFLLKMVIF